MHKPLVGISSCLLGNRVRYDGGHQRMDYLDKILGSFVTYLPLCPEYESGLTIPREALRLVRQNGETHLLTQRSQKDCTTLLDTWTSAQLLELAKEPLCGYIFKAKSPSCGVFRVKEYDEEGVTLATDRSGIFARALIERFPHLPIEEDGRMNDPVLRENFIERIFFLQRWHTLQEAPLTVKRLTDFHASHKYILMAHSPHEAPLLGHMIAQVTKENLTQVAATYLIEVLTVLKNPATVKTNTNTLQHIMGYFKSVLSADEKQELTEILMRYHQGEIPLIVPVTILNHFVRKYKEPYLQQQYYLHPSPSELMVRNHV